jgi:hypothetical protein
MVTTMRLTCAVSRGHRWTFPTVFPALTEQRALLAGGQIPKRVGLEAPGLVPRALDPKTVG